MKFALWMKQQGEGCDYMIACGEKVETFSADNQRHARGKAKQMILEHDGDFRIGKAALFKVAQDLPVDEWYDRVDSVRKARRRKIEEEKEKAELARLQAKYK